MRYLSVCSGIEAATVAWHPLGWQAAGFSEIDKFPSAVLAHHYPAVRNFGDFTTIEETDVGAIDLLVGGTPCQSFSVAGLRGGLGDDRGNLALEFCRLALRTRPRWLVWENVPGVLSSNGGRDFGSILGALAGCGYGFAYRVLDAQYFGLAQRRKRVFVVGHLGDWRPAAAVLFERESLRGDPAPRRSTGQRVAGTLEARAGTGVYDPGAHGAASGHLIASTGNVPHCLNAGGMGRQDYETETLVAHSLRGEGFDASEDGTGRGTPLVPVAFMSNASGANLSWGHDQSPTLRIGGDGGNAMAIAFMENQRGEIRTDDIAAALSAGGGKPGQGYSAVAFDLRGRDGGAQFEGPHDTANIRAASGGSSRSYVASTAVRRLTPRECERLQGFPDDYTAVPYRGKPASDGPRYKALGNSMAVPCMRWLGERIAMVDALLGDVAA